MKHNYLLLGIAMLMHSGGIAYGNELYHSPSKIEKPSLSEKELFKTTHAFQTITGQVIDETGSPLPGVSIIVKGTSIGTVTNIDGKYSVEAIDESSTLLFSFIGYTTQEIIVGTRTTIDISLLVDEKSLEEVVVTALGIKKESKKLGYSATS